MNRSSKNGLKDFLFGDLSDSVTNYDAAIILFLIGFLFSTTLSIAAMNIMYAIAVFLWLGRMVYRKKFDIPKTSLDMFFVAFVIAEGISLVFSYNKEQSMLYMYRRVTLLPVMYVLVGNIRSSRLLRILFGTLVLSMLFVSFWSLRGLFVHLHEFLMFERRLQNFQMYMTAGGMMMIGMLLLLPFVLHKKTPRAFRVFAVAALIPIGTNLLFTFTRSSWLGFLAGAVIIGTFRAKKLFLPLAIVVITVVMISSPEMKERMSSTFNPYHPNNVSRMRMWETGIKIFKDNPIVGVGDIGIEHVWPQYAPPDWEPAGHLHNNLIMWLVTLGLLGFVALVSLFVKIWLVISRIEKKVHDNWFAGSVAIGVLAVLAGFHVNGLFEWNFGDAEIIIVVWALVGMALSLDKISSPVVKHV